MKEYNFELMGTGDNRMRITVSKGQIHLTKETLLQLGNPKSLKILYDKGNKAIRLSPGGDRVVGYSPNREDYPRISSTLGRYYMPLGRYYYVSDDNVFIHLNN